MTDSDIAWGMRYLALDMSLLKRSLDEALPHAERQSAHTALQEQTRLAFKKAALALHPDRTGGDTSKTEDFKRLAALVDVVAQLPVPQPVRKKVVVDRYQTTVRFTSSSIVL